MIKRIRRRTITETKQAALLIDSAARGDLRCCATCGDQKMVSPLLAAKILETGTREIYRLIEAGKIHFNEMPDKQIFVCLQSIIEMRAVNEQGSD